MDKTPTNRHLKLSNKKKDSDTDNESVLSQLSASSCQISTANNQKGAEDNDDSPVYYPCTQEGFENLDVGWDWNSPQGKQKKRQKRLLLSHSPKLTIKRHPSNSNVKNFEKLKEELLALREQLADPGNDCPVVSPFEETEFKSKQLEPEEHSPLDCLIEESKKICDKDLEDLFNDSADEDLLLCSQQVELKLNNVDPEKSNNYENNRKKYENVKVISFSTNMADDSFDTALEDIKEDQILNLTKVFQTSDKNHSKNQPNNNTNNFVRSKSDVECSKMSIGKVEFHRTHSFELSNLGQSEHIISKVALEEIEKKRKEALAKLESKRKQENCDASNSPFKCSPEEIEQKRLQALAKLEAKRQQDIIERKRQEALKKLQMKRKINVKSSLTKRL